MKQWAVDGHDFVPEYAKFAGVGPHALNESKAEYRIRVAQALWAKKDRIRAVEVLYNSRERPDPFILFGGLDRGYGDSHLLWTANTVEAMLQERIRYEEREAKLRKYHPLVRCFARLFM